jgi:hypothetical protein
VGDRRARVRKLRVQLAREKAEVVEAERATLAALVSAILGRRETALERERADVVRAKLQLDAECDALTALEESDAALAAEIAALGDVAAEIDAARAACESMLRESDPARRAQLDEIDGALAAFAPVRREIDEALDAARDAMTALDSVLRSLERAESMGQADMWGIGFGIGKYSEIDDARTSSHRAQRAMDRLRREMRDVAGVSVRSVAVDVDPSPVLRVFDVLLDDIVSDLISQARITRSAQGVRRARLSVVEAMGSLRARRDECAAKAAALEDERRRLVEGA